VSQPQGDDLKLQESYRAAAKNHEEAADELRNFRILQRVFVFTLVGAVLLAGLLGYSVVVGLWHDKPVITRYVGLIAVLAVWAGMGYALWRNRKNIVLKSLEVRNKLHDKQSAAAKLPLDSASALRIYRESSLEMIDQYRRGAARNRRVHNMFQIAIIVGSITVTTLTAANSKQTAVHWSAAILSAVVSASAGVTGYFKFRERGYNLQSTADEIEKHFNAAQFQLDEYEEVEGENESEKEKARLRLYAKFVERIREEQRKRELQLEQTSSSDDRN